MPVPNVKTPATFSKRQWSKVLLSLIAAAGAMLWLSWQLASRLHPWEKVLTIDSVFEDEGYAGTGSYPLMPTIDLSPDDQNLVTARPDGTCEIWDLSSLEKVVTFAKPMDFSSEEEDRISRGANLVHYNAGGDIFIKHDERWQIFDGEGKIKHDFRRPTYARTACLSPDGKLLANSSSSPALVYNLATHKQTALFGPQVFRGSRRFQWFDNGQRLLLHDSYFVSVFDLATWQPVFFHHELDLRLPPPMISAQLIEEEMKRREWGARVVVCQLAANDTKIACLYSSADIGGGLRDIGSQVDRLRFYDAQSGELLADHVLPYPGRSLEVSPDQSIVYVAAAPNFSTAIQVHDASSGAFIRDLRFKNDSRFPTHITAMPDNRHVVTHHTRTWIVDTTDELPQLKLLDWPANVPEVRVSGDGKTIVAAQNTKKIHVWKQRHSPSRWGALAFWEYHLIHVIGIASVIGLLIWTGRNSEALTETRLPKGVWIVALLGGLSVGGSFADWFCEPLLFDVYEFGDPQTWVKRTVSLCGVLFWCFAIARLLQFRNAWRKFVVFMLALGMAASAYRLFPIIKVWSLSSELPATTPTTLSSGWRLDVSLPLLLFGLLPAIFLATGACLWLLCKRSTRQVFADFVPLDQNRYVEMPPPPVP